MKKSNKLPIATSPAVCAPPSYKQSKADIDRNRRYQAEDALRDIQRVEGYKQNKQLMSDVKSLAKEQLQALSKVVK